MDVEPWFSTRGSQTTLLQGLPRPLENTDIFFTIHYSNRVTIYEVTMKIVVWLEVTTTEGTILNGHSIGEAEKHCDRARNYVGSCVCLSPPKAESHVWRSLTKWDARRLMLILRSLATMRETLRSLPCIFYLNCHFTDEDVEYTGEIHSAC